MSYNAISQILRQARQAALDIGCLSSQAKDRALWKMSRRLVQNTDYILGQNRKDLDAAQSQGLSPALIDRLRLSPQRIKEMAVSLAAIKDLPDPAGKAIRKWRRPNGLRIEKVRVPIGVILIIYEARPNVTSDCIGLCLKSGNVTILKGGKEAFYSNRAIFRVLRDAAKDAGLKKQPFYLIPSTKRDAVRWTLQQDEYIDLVIPRGGEGLIRAVTKISRIPVIKHYKGICAVYVDKDANLKMAQEVCFNAKVQRPSVCNAMETLLVHRDVAHRFLPPMIARLRKADVEIRGCPQSYKICRREIKRAKDKDWTTEYLGLTLAARVVADTRRAIEHINTYGSHHSDAIITNNPAAAKEFLQRVDSAVVFHNASTRFSDGYQFGMGAEIGISTDKVHARGPMALEELTIYKYRVLGRGQVRK
ncbi:MAG: glutamate-5-semialdehyde dehydrogenase [Candidatus Omnitrophota bacterium]